MSNRRLQFLILAVKTCQNHLVVRFLANCFFVAHRNRTCWVPGLRSLIALLLGTLIEPAGSHRDRLKSQEEEESRFQTMFFSGERRGAEASVQETCERLGGGFLCSMDF